MGRALPPPPSFGQNPKEQQFFLGKPSLRYPTSGPTGTGLAPNTNFFPLLEQCSNLLEFEILYHIHKLQNAKTTTERTASLARRVFDFSLLLDIFVPEEGCNTTNAIFTFFQQFFGIVKFFNAFVIFVTFAICCIFFS